MRKIPIYKKVKQVVGYALVDDEDFNLVNETEWFISGRKYASATKKVGGAWKAIYLHKVIMPSKGELVVDHINGDTLDNRKSNLRICTKHQNIINAGKRKDNSSGFRGVYKVKKKGKERWQAKAVLEGRQYHFGYFDSAQEAAEAYKISAKKLYGEFARDF